MYKKIAVILDAGHGFNTLGKRSIDGSLRENEFNRAVLNKLTLLLELNKIRYEILVPEFYDVSLSKRVKREKALHKQLKK